MSVGDDESRIVLIAKTNVAASDELTYASPSACACFHLMELSISMVFPL